MRNCEDNTHVLYIITSSLRIKNCVGKIVKLFHVYVQLIKICLLFIYLCLYFVQLCSVLYNIHSALLCSHTVTAHCFVDTWIPPLSFNIGKVIIQRCGILHSQMAVWEFAWTYWDAWYHERATRTLPVIPVRFLALKCFCSSPFRYQPFRLLYRNTITIHLVLLLWFVNFCKVI
jgi:hypothetical protein